MLKTFVSTCMLAGFVCALSASPLDKRTIFTFSQPVAMPGVTLPAGTYTFRVLDPATSGKVVQVLNANGTRNYGMFLSMSAVRQDWPEKPEISFMETGAGVPPAIKTWWYPGSKYGYEFVYSKAQADRLARGIAPAPAEATTDLSASTISSIDTSDDDAVAPVAAAEPAEPREEERVAALGQAEVAQQTAQSGQAAQPAPVTPEPAPAPVNQGVREELPRTATILPLAVMLGSGMLFGGMWLKRKAQA